MGEGIPEQRITVQRVTCMPRTQGVPTKGGGGGGGGGGKEIYCNYNDFVDDIIYPLCYYSTQLSLRTVNKL